VSICTIVVHGPLAQPVLLGPLGLGYERGGCPMLTQGIPSFRILNQPVNCALNILPPFVGTSLNLSVEWCSLADSTRSYGSRQ
jgi:hypothetical protein